MRRFLLLLANEFKLFRTAIPIHVVVIVQPTVMYVLMAVILVTPTFDMNVTRPETDTGRALVAAMEAVGSPISDPYINPILVDGEGVASSNGEDSAWQVITIEERDGTLTAVQRYGLIDSNIVKNLRNRLTAAAFLLWNAELGGQAVTIEEHPWLPRDVPYGVYFGMALLPMTVFLAGSVIGAVLTAGDFESGAILEYRLAPTPLALILGARLTRLVLMAYVSAGVALVAVGLIQGVWPRSLAMIALILLPAAVIAGCLGILAGCLMRKTIPAFLVGLVASFVGWIMGGAFGLAAGFGGTYEFVSRLTPLTHVAELLFPQYYGLTVGAPLVSTAVLLLFGGGSLILTALAYHWQVRRQS